MYKAAFLGDITPLITGRGPPCLGLDVYRVLLDLQSPPVLRSHVFFFGQFLPIVRIGVSDVPGGMFLAFVGSFV